MRFGHYTVFDTPAENKHTQAYVEYDVPNNDNLDGATGTMILSDGSSDTSGGGGDSRFSTCEVEVLFTLNNQPLTLESYGVKTTTNFAAGTLVEPDHQHAYYSATAVMDNSSNTMTPLLFNGAAYVLNVYGLDAAEHTYHVNTDVEPILTGDLSLGNFEDVTVVIVRGDGTVTFEMIEEE